MRAAKQTLIVCWIITIVSLLGIVILHAEIDIWFQEQITKTKWTYDYSERDFYQSIWSNIFTGAIVSVFTTYVSYIRAKNDVVFNLSMSEQMLTLKFGLLASPMYSINLKNPQNNHAAICRFTNQIAETHAQYDRMVEANNDYSPFFKTKRAKALMDGKIFLQEIWLEICGVEDDLLVYENEESLKEAIDETRKKIEKSKDQLKKLYEDIQE